MSIRIILVDDQKLFVESLKTVIQAVADDIEVVGIANNGKGAIELLDQMKDNLPDVVLLDVWMPEMDGVTCLKELKERHKDLRVLMLTTIEDEDYVRNSMQLGASGYLLKDMGPQELADSIRMVHKGNVLINPNVASSLFTRQHSPSQPMSRKDSSLPYWWDEMTLREKEVLRLMLKGFSNKDIATKLFVAEQTVRNYVSSIYQKMDQSNRVKVIEAAKSIPYEYYPR